MYKRVQLGLIITVISMLFAAAAAAHADVQVGKPPPDFLGKDDSGNKVLVSEHRGKLVIVTFFASWCGPCRRELPILEGIQKIAGKDKVFVVAINWQEEVPAFRAIRRQLKDYQLTMTHDRNGRIGVGYGVKAIPRLVIVGKDGNVAAEHLGYGEDSLPGLVNEINALWRANP